MSTVVVGGSIILFVARALPVLLLACNYAESVEMYLKMAV